jgi:hypothetical protein
MLCVWYSSGVIGLSVSQSTNMVIVPCTWERDFRGLQEGAFSGHIVADYCGQIPWPYSGQGIEMEGTAKKCDN